MSSSIETVNHGRSSLRATSNPAAVADNKTEPTSVWVTPLLAPGNLYPVPELQPFHDRAAFLTVSELARFHHCRHHHYLSDRKGLKRTRVPRLFDPPSAAEIGTAFHRYAQYVRPDWTPEYQLARARASLGREWFPIDDSMLEEGAHRIVVSGARLLASPWWQQMHRATNSRQEMQFLLTIDRYSLLDGTVDAVYERHGGLTVVDYKTAALGDDPALSMGVVAARHELQAAAYALAMQATIGLPVRRFVFFFPERGTSYVLRPTQAWLTSWHGKLAAISREIMGLVKDSPVVSRYESARCDECALRHICRPYGDPSLGPVSRQVGALEKLA
jgi:CRISPR/Cas system-associated exonuclease Cas4 (RecB family)